MAVYAGPDIVENGLVLCLDAANPQSYPGTGTGWTDLSNTRNNGVLINGPSYSFLNNGYVNFDGLNDYVNCGSVQQIGSSLTALTVEAWVYPTAATTSMIAENGTSFNTNTFYLAQETSTKFSFSVYGPSGQDVIVPVETYSVNTWYHLVGVWQSNIPVTFYINSNIVTDSGMYTRTTLSALQNGNTNLFLGIRNATSFPFAGRISNLKLYNIRLNEIQIKQNFNALRGRFNI